MFTAEQISRFILKSYFTLLNRTYVIKGNLSLPPEPKIIAMNHTPGADPLYLPFILEETPHFLLQDGLFTIPIIGWMLKETGQISVYRGTERAKNAKEQACRCSVRAKHWTSSLKERMYPAGSASPPRQEL